MKSTHSKITSIDEVNDGAVLSGQEERHELTDHGDEEDQQQLYAESVADLWDSVAQTRVLLQ